MKLRTLSKIILFLSIFAMVLSFASCKDKGSLKLESFTIDRTSVKTSYIVGEEIDFSGIKAIARYSDNSLDKIYTFSELTVSYAEDITATVGEKEVSISFNDPHLNVKQEAKITITVSEAPNLDNITDPLNAIGFEKPSSLIQFDSANQSAGTIKYGEAGFFGQFAVGQKTYVIGNENEFKLNPQLVVFAEDGTTMMELKEFFSVVDVFVEKNGAYVALTKTEGENNMVSYSDGETLLVTVDTYKGTYQFSADAAGKKVKISVLPSEEYYVANPPLNPVVLEANVIQAYNVYEAWQLAVIDNYNTDWADHKAAHGLTDVNVSGVVFHNDIKLTADDVPASFFYVTEHEVVYKNVIDNSTVTIPAGTKYIKDMIEVYHRLGEGTFAIEGNFFTLNTSDFPLVASPAVFGTDAEKDYGSDFSNVSLFYFISAENEEAIVENPLEVSIHNLSIIGNAKRDNLVDANENLASAGGLIFLKSAFYGNVSMDNIIGNSYFITYFTEHGVLDVSNAKCFDSYQNTVFAWGDSILTIENSYLEGSGGPVVIAQSDIQDGRHPTLTTTDTLVKTNVSGEEIWFTAVGANALVGNIKGLGEGLKTAGLGNYVDANGKMNVMGLLMPAGSDAAVAVTGIDAQGSISMNGAGINRYQTAENINWATIKEISEYAMSAGAQMPPFFTVTDASGTAYTIYFNGTTFVDLNGQTLGTDASHAALVAAFQAADGITLTQGGLSVVFEFYHN